MMKERMAARSFNDNNYPRKLRGNRYINGVRFSPLYFNSAPPNSRTTTKSAPTGNLKKIIYRRQRPIVITPKNLNIKKKRKSYHDLNIATHFMTGNPLTPYKKISQLKPKTMMLLL